MMIIGIAVTAGVSGQFLDPYTPARLMSVVGVVTALAFTAPASPSGASRPASSLAPNRKCAVP
jgi:hypothetical protein